LKPCLDYLCPVDLCLSTLLVPPTPYKLSLILRNFSSKLFLFAAAKAQLTIAFKIEHLKQEVYKHLHCESFYKSKYKFSTKIKTFFPVVTIKQELGPTKGNKSFVLLKRIHCTHSLLFV
jgi:hypothetical protein